MILSALSREKGKYKSNHSRDIGCFMCVCASVCKHEDFKSAHYRTMFTVTNSSLHSSNQINYVICIGCYSYFPFLIFYWPTDLLLLRHCVVCEYRSYAMFRFYLSCFEV